MYAMGQKDSLDRDHMTDLFDHAKTSKKAPKKASKKAAASAKKGAASRKERAGESQYSARDIEVLEGLEPVRRRPGMFVGGTDESALHHLAAEGCRPRQRLTRGRN